MSDVTNNEFLTDLIEDYIAHLEGAGDAPDLSQLDPDSRITVEGILRTVLAAWRSEVDIPPRSGDDKTATASSPSATDKLEHSEVMLDGDTIKSARMRRHLSPSEVDQRLNKAGHSVPTNWTVRAERNPTAVSPELATTLALILGVSAGQLSDVSDMLSAFRRWLSSDDFEEQALAWFEKERLTYSPEKVKEARSQLQLVHQRSLNDARAQWIAMLHAILEQLR